MANAILICTRRFAKQSSARVPGVVTYTIGPCDLDWHVDREIVAAACVGGDLIKVWPLPVEQPWWEDASEMPDVDLACRVQDESFRNAQTCAIEIALSVV